MNHTATKLNYRTTSMNEQLQEGPRSEVKNGSYANHGAGKAFKGKR